jgi:hypothetical protein
MIYVYQRFGGTCCFYLVVNTIGFPETSLHFCQTALHHKNIQNENFNFSFVLVNL